MYSASVDLHREQNCHVFMELVLSDPAPAP